MSTPGDQVVVVGYNNSNIELIWRLDLARKTFDRAKILESLTNSFVGIIPLYFSSRSPPILTEYQDRNNVTLVVDSGIVTLILVIHNMTQSDKIYYRVEVEDNLGSTKTDNLVISIYVFPRVQVFSNQTTYSENQTITLHCNATGNPTPTISWKQMNHPSRSFPSASSLIIATANETDGGEYKCIGTNSVGSDEASLNITVIHIALEWSLCCYASNSSISSSTVKVVNTSSLLSLYYTATTAQMTATTNASVSTTFQLNHTSTWPTNIVPNTTSSWRTTIAPNITSSERTAIAPTSSGWTTTVQSTTDTTFQLNYTSTWPTNIVPNTTSSWRTTIAPNTTSSERTAIAPNTTNSAWTTTVQSTTEPPSRGTLKNELYIAIGVGVGFGCFFLAIAIVLVICYKKKKSQVGPNVREMETIGDEHHLVPSP